MPSSPPAPPREAMAEEEEEEEELSPDWRFDSSLSAKSPRDSAEDSAAVDVIFDFECAVEIRPAAPEEEEEEHMCAWIVAGGARIRIHTAEKIMQQRLESRER